VCTCTQPPPLPQVKAESSVESKHQTLQGLAFPLQDTARRALHQLAQKRINYIQLVRPSCHHVFIDYILYC